VSPLEDTLDQLARTAENVARLEPRLSEARVELHRLIRLADVEGAGREVIARVAGLSKERVRQILARQP
jgi:hypothetical protein